MPKPTVPAEEPDPQALMAALAAEKAAEAAMQYGDTLLKINAITELASQFNGRHILLYCVARMAHLCETTQWATPQEEIQQLDKLAAMASRLGMVQKRMGNTEAVREGLSAIRNNHPPLERVIPSAKS